MPNINAHKNVTFARERGFPMPWQARYKPIPESKVDTLLVKGEELAVKGPHQSAFLPLRSSQDRAEFDYFQTGTGLEKLSKPEVAQELSKMSRNGTSFFQQGYHEKREIGPFGAYNYLTGQLEASVVELAFSQPVLKLKLKSSEDFKGFVAGQSLVENLVRSTPEELRTEHRSILLKALGKNPRETDGRKLSKLAADYLKDETTASQLLPIMFQGIKEVEARQDIISGLMNAKGDSGEPFIEDAASMRALYTAALEEDQSNEGYFNSVMEHSGREGRVLLSLALGPILVPKDMTFAQELTPSQTAEAQMIRSVLLRAKRELPEEKNLETLVIRAKKLLGEDNLKSQTQNLLTMVNRSQVKLNGKAKFTQELLERKNSKGGPLLSPTAKEILILASLDSESSDLDYITATRRQAQKLGFEVDSGLMETLYPQKTEFVQSWLKDTPEEDRADLEAWLSATILDNPELKNEYDILTALPDNVPYVTYTREEDQAKVTRLYRRVLEKSANARSQTALRVGDLRDQDGDHILGGWARQQRFYQAFFDPQNTDLELMKKSLDECPSEHRGQLSLSLLEELRPESAAIVRELTILSEPDLQAEHRTVLAVAASIDSSTGKEELIKRALELGNEEMSPYRTLGLDRLLAEEVAQKSEFSRLLLETADTPGLESSWGLTSTARKVLIEAAANPKLHKDRILEDLTAELSDDHASEIRRSLGSKLYPDLAKRVQEVTRFSPKEHKRFHWDLLFQSALAHPKVTEPQRLVENAVSLFQDDLYEESKFMFYEMGLKATIDKNPFAAPILDCLRNEYGHLCVEAESASSLCRAALKPHVSALQLLETIKNSADEYDQAYLARIVGLELLGSADLDTPEEVLRKLQAGEYTSAEILELVQTVEQTSPIESNTSIGVDEELLIVGDEVLEVDLG